MNTTIIKTIFLIILSLQISVNIFAQQKNTIYVDVGETNMSNGLFIKTTDIFEYKFAKNNITAGTQFDFMSINNKIFTGTTIKYSRDFAIKKIPFEAEALFIYNPFSELIHESNIGLLLSHKQKHFTYRLGTNFRTFKLTKKAIEDDNVTENKKVHEYRNIMYLLRYNLKESDSEWNAGISLTNIDHFIINQETNPVFYLHGRYNISKPITIFTEAWYKSAGSLNISVNYFGFFIRTGLIWKLNTNK